MTKEHTTAGLNITREEMIRLLNEDLVGEQEHEIDLSAALDINVPPAIKPAAKNGRNQLKNNHASRR